MNKRDFFKFLALSPVVVPLATVAHAREGDEPIDGAAILSICGGQQLAPRKMIADNELMLIDMQTYDPNKRVDITVGNDGHLWIRSNKDQWKRVVTE